MRAIATGAGIVIGALLLFLLGSIAFFTIGRRADFVDQRHRVDALQRVGVASASLAADLSVPEDLPLDHLRMIATHNSYRRRADGLRLFFIGLAQPGEPARLDYAHPPLSAQLDAGLRSFELDVRLRTGQFQVTHVPLVDDRSTAPDLRLALREIALWSDGNRGHVPVILLFELKDDYMLLDQGLQRIDGPELDRLDALLRSELGSRLLTPDDVRADAPSLASARATSGWPRVGTVRGRILVILHENEAYRQAYIAGRPTLEGRAMFTCAPAGAPDAAIAILNDPVADRTKIAELVARGVLVRTRADGDGVHGAEGLAAALASGAQVISTDFPPSYPAPDGYQASFAQGRLLEARP